MGSDQWAVARLVVCWSLLIPVKPQWARAASAGCGQPCRPKGSQAQADLLAGLTDEGGFQVFALVELAGEQVPLAVGIAGVVALGQQDAVFTDQQEQDVNEAGVVHVAVFSSWSVAEWTTGYPGTTRPTAATRWAIHPTRWAVS